MSKFAEGTIEVDVIRYVPNVIYLDYKVPKAYSRFTLFNVQTRVFLQRHIYSSVDTAITALNRFFNTKEFKGKGNYVREQNLFIENYVVVELDLKKVFEQYDHFRGDKEIKEWIKRKAEKEIK